MPSRLPEGLVAAWAADSMSTTFPGGLWHTKAEKDAGWPYVVYLDQGEGLLFSTSGGEAGQADFTRPAFQINIWYKADGTNDPVSQLGTLMRTFDSFVQSHNRSLFHSATEGRVMEVRCVDRRIDQTEDDEIWQGQLDYMARRLRLVSA